MQTGKRGDFFGIDWYSEGDCSWKGDNKSDEKGCVGCPWYDLADWKEKLARKRELSKIPVTLPNGIVLKLSVGEHNELHKKIIEELLPRFGFGAEVLYIGDTEKKLLYVENEKLKNLHFFTLGHEELPDIVAYSEEKNILYMIEAVHSFGPMSEIRINKIKRALEATNAKTELAFFTAFLDKKTFRKWCESIAWETEVWIADNPDHLIHFNGYKFLEIHK